MKSKKLLHDLGKIKSRYLTFTLLCQKSHINPSNSQLNYFLERLVIHCSPDALLYWYLMWKVKKNCHAFYLILFIFNLQLSAIPLLVTRSKGPLVSEQIFLSKNKSQGRRTPIMFLSTREFYCLIFKFFKHNF